VRLVLDPGDGVAVSELPPPWSGEPDGPLSTSIDGRTVGWLQSSISDESATPVEDGPRVAHFMVVRDRRSEQVSLPLDTLDASVSADGRSIVVQTTRGWTLRDLDSMAYRPLAGDTFSRVQVLGDRIAMVRSGFRDGQLCLQTLAS
jgi:hypothetical protein